MRKVNKSAYKSSNPFTNAAIANNFSAFYQTG